MMARSVPEKRIMSANIICALLSLFDLLALEDGTNRLSWNVGNNLPLYAGNIPKGYRSRMMIGQCRPWFGSAW